MSSISHRGNYQFQATVRRKGYPTQSKTFESRRDADKWARDVETQIDQGVFKDRREAENTTLNDALERYRLTVTSAKRGLVAETNRIRQLKALPMAQRSLDSLQAKDFAAYRDARLQVVSKNTVRLELSLLSHVFTIAINEWCLPLEHPLKKVKKPSAPDGRDRRLVGDEEARLMAALHRPEARSAALWLQSCITIAIETGMRAGELLTLQWTQVNFNQNVIRLDKSKNGSARSVPLSEKAQTCLQHLPRHIGGQVIPNFHDTSGLDRAFKRLCKAANIHGLRYHDLRHEAASRLAPHMPVQTLAKIMGWKTLQMAMRYYNPTEQELVDVVRRATRG
ncbi:MAG: site-specific integrase [Azonexus sp.]|nr:site-specific integrase [Azonexus sp.]